jgi:uncharacterized protein (DUF1499 family)
MARQTIPYSIILIGSILVLASGAAAVLAGLGTRWAWWDFRTGFLILRWSAYGGLAGSLACALGLLGSLRTGMSGMLVPALAGLVIGLVIFGIPLNMMRTAKRVPPIHDITTDTDDPPKFIAIMPLRKNALNPAEYGGPDIAAQQHKAYPEVKPLLLGVPAEAAFDSALAVVRRMGWEIVDANRSEGRIEAVDRTFWFGFQDDIVIRISHQASASRIDVRSVSRVGKSDIGANAKRVTAFLNLMQK